MFLTNVKIEGPTEVQGVVCVGPTIGQRCTSGQALRIGIKSGNAATIWSAAVPLSVVHKWHSEIPAIAEQFKDNFCGRYPVP
jgi:hypothetical protein